MFFKSLTRARWRCGSRMRMRYWGPRAQGTEPAEWKATIRACGASRIDIIVILLEAGFLLGRGNKKPVAAIAVAPSMAPISCESKTQRTIARAEVSLSTIYRFSITVTSRHPSKTEATSSENEERDRRRKLRSSNQ
ncbi:hypothetical protein U1Q18_043913 [Sarracenia purpurea var. burkii]